MTLEEFKARVRNGPPQDPIRPLRVHDLRSAQERAKRMKRLPPAQQFGGSQEGLRPGLLNDFMDLNNIEPDRVKLMLDKICDIDEARDNLNVKDGDPVTYPFDVEDDTMEQDFRDALMLLDEIMSLGARFRRNGGKANKKLTRDFYGYLDAVELFLDSYTSDKLEDTKEEVVHEVAGDEGLGGV